MWNSFCLLPKHDCMLYGVHYPPKLHLDVHMADIISTGLGNTEYPLHITEAYVDFETESLLHEAINVAAKHYVLEVAMEMQAEAKVKMEAIR
ncbi:hypothetical protein Bca101_097335 [Brassica carinata]